MTVWVLVLCVEAVPISIDKTKVKEPEKEPEKPPASVVRILRVCGITCGPLMA